MGEKPGKTPSLKMASPTTTAHFNILIALNSTYKMCKNIDQRRP
jgi:hypothetical protein